MEGEVESDSILVLQSAALVNFLLDVLDIHSIIMCSMHVASRAFFVFGCKVEKARFLPDYIIFMIPTVKNNC